MFSLIHQDEDGIEYKGQTLKVNGSFDNILKLMELKQEVIFEEWEKVILTYKILIVDADSYDFDIQEIGEIIALVFELMTDGNETPKEAPPFDFSYDAERIYSSFLMCYGIDLKKEIGEMSWQKFMALLNTLTDESPLVKAIGYRVMEIPAANKIGADERKRLQKLKEAYELPIEKERRQQKMLEQLQRRLEKGLNNGRLKN